MSIAMNEFVDRMRFFQIETGRYIDEINRERARYLAGLIDVEEFERRVGEHLQERAA